MLSKKIIGLACVLLLIVYANAQDTTQQVIPGRYNDKKQEQKPYVILISADGFRADLAEKYHAVNLLRLKDKGVQASYMLSSFPSLTFPNHYSIVTGMYPSHHGIVDNTFFDERRGEQYTLSNKKAVADSSWYGGRPLWVLAEQQQMLSASFYWVASESAIEGIRPTYYYVYSDKISIDERLQAVKRWLQLPEDKRPHFITFYFPQVDHAEHAYSAESPQTEEAVKFVDESVGKMVAMTDSLHLPVNYIFVSDHGMTTIDNNKAIGLPAAIDTTRFVVPYGEAVLHLYAKDSSFIMPTYTALKKEAQGYDVYLSANIPERWHYSKKDDRYNRIGDIILVPRLPGFFNISGKPNKSIGKHGFDPAITDMHAVFYAWGPAFKQHLTIAPFENVNIYPLIAKILQLKYEPGAIDGKLQALNPILK